MTLQLRTVESRQATDHDFTAFYHREVRAVVGLAVSLSGHTSTGEDIAQEAFARAYREWDRVRTYEKPGAWVRRVVANLAISRWRRRSSEQRALARLRGRPMEPAAFEALDHEFWQAVRSLPRRQALVIALRYIEDRSVRDIAGYLDLPEGTVKSLLHRARRRLSSILTEDAR